MTTFPFNIITIISIKIHGYSPLGELGKKAAGLSRVYLWLIIQALSPTSQNTMKGRKRTKKKWYIIDRTSPRNQLGTSFRVTPNGGKREMNMQQIGSRPDGRIRWEIKTEEWGEREINVK